MRKKNKIKSYRDCSQNPQMERLYSDKVVSQKRKEGTERVFQISITKTGRAEEIKQTRLDESCDFKVVSEDDATARRHVR